MSHFKNQEEVPDFRTHPDRAQKGSEAIWGQFGRFLTLNQKSQIFEVQDLPCSYFCSRRFNRFHHLQFSLKTSELYWVFDVDYLQFDGSLWVQSHGPGRGRSCHLWSRPRTWGSRLCGAGGGAARCLRRLWESHREGSEQASLLL